MKKAELLLDGPNDRTGGAQDKTGKKRGPYGIGGDSDHTARQKRQKLVANNQRKWKPCFDIRGEELPSWDQGQRLGRPKGLSNNPEELLYLKTII